MLEPKPLTLPQVVESIPNDQGNALVNRLRALYGGPKPASKIRDRRLRNLAIIIESAPDNWRAIQGGIKGTGLSCAYLSVRFKEEAELPMRSYALWLKFEHACLLVHTGSSARDAAIVAGFADQSHLGRAARRFARKSFGQVQEDVNRLLDELNQASAPPLSSVAPNLGSLKRAS